MKTIGRLIIAVALMMGTALTALAQEAQENETPRETPQTEREKTAPTAQEYEAEEETPEDVLPAEKALKTETEGTYDAETENVPTMETETYRSEAENEGLIEEEDTVGSAAMQVQNFTTYDVDKDGRIDEEEFKTSYTHSYTAWDTNQDGVLDEGEFQTGQGAVAAQQDVTDQEGVTSQEGVTEQYKEDSKTVAEKPGQMEEFVSSVFETIDEDGDGYIDEEEFSSWTDTQGK